jgi:predicted ATP-grasp superfamily ATP-dependent carboligase
MRRILVYEYLSGGGTLDHEADAAALLPQGLAMRDAIVADLLALPDVEVACVTSARAGLPVEHPRLGAVALRPGEAAPDLLQREARRHDLVWVVAPESDGVLLALHEAVGSARWVGCSAAAICVASSKRATLAALAAAKLPTPLDVADATRWVVKPDDGAGAVDIRVHESRAAALADQQARRRRGAIATVEAYVEGETLSVSMLAGPGFVQPLSFNRQSIEIDADGMLHYRGVRTHALDLRGDPRATRLHLLALDVKRALPGLRGFVGFDLVWHPERGPVVIEVNPRVTCAYVGQSAARGSNIAAEILLLQQLSDPDHAGH